MRVLWFALVAVACSCELAFPVYETNDAAFDAGDGGGADSPIDASSVLGCSAPGLVTFYPTDEGAGGTLHDCSPNHNSANLNGTYAWCRHDAGTSHPCISLFPDAGWAAAGDLNNLYGFPGDATISLWLRVDVAPPKTGCPAGGCLGYVVNYRSNNNQKVGWALVVDSSLVVSFLVGQGGAQTQPLTLQRWTYVTAVLRAGSNITMYVDGASLGPVPFDGGAPPVTSNISLLLGDFETSSGQPTNTQYDQLNGSLDEVRIFNRALDASEVSALYNGGVP